MSAAARRFKPSSVLLPVVAPVVVFIHGLLGRALIAPNDGYQLNLPLRVLAARVWRTGHLPAWNEFEFSGYPILATAQAGVFYPPHALYVVLGPLAANNLSIVVHFALAGGGAWLLARRLCHDDVAAAVGGLAFGLSGFLFGHVGHQNMLESAAWMPWVFLGYELVLERFTAARLALGGGALALSLFAGHAQMPFLILLALGVYGAALAALDVGGRVRPLLAGVAVAAVGFALAGPQVVPIARILETTSRSGLGFEDAMSFSFPVSHLTLVLFPLAFGAQVASGPISALYRGEWNLIELSGYPGLAAVVLATASVPLARRERRVVAFLLAACFGLLLALGSAAPLGRVVYELPIFGGFRAWGRAVLVVDLAVAMLAAYGTVALRAVAWPGRRTAVRCSLTSAAVLVGIALVLPHVDGVGRLLGDGGDRAFAFGLPLGAAVIAAAAAAGLERLPRAATIAMVSVVAVDLVASYGLLADWRTGSPPVQRVDRDYASDAHALFGEVAPAPGGVDRAAIVGTQGASLVGPYASRAGPFDAPKVTVALRVRSISGYDTLVPSDYLEAVGGMTPWGDVESGALIGDGSDVLDVLRVTTVVFDPGSVPAAERLGPARRLRAGLHRVDRRPLLPDAYLVGAVEERAKTDVVAALHGALPWEPAERAFVDRRCDACRRMDRPGAAGTVRPVARRSGAIDVTVDAVSPSLLVVSEAWFPGWRADVDGDRVEVVRANGLVLGVPVGPGRHVVRLRYRTPGLRAGVVLAATTIGGLLALGWAQRRFLGLLLGGRAPEPGEEGGGATGPGDEGDEEAGHAERVLEIERVVE